jgi:hypothetical protein
MAARTGRIARMVARVTGATVPEVDAQPVSGVMTAITLLAGDKMIARLARGGRAIVTTGTTAVHFIVINAGNRCPQGSVMTGLAGIGRQDVAD